MKLQEIAENSPFFFCLFPLCWNFNSMFSLVMSSPGGPGMVKRVNITSKSLQHGDNYVVIFWRETKNKANWCAQHS